MRVSLQNCAPFIAKCPPSAGFERTPIAGVADGSAITGDRDPISRLLAIPAYFGVPCWTAPNVGRPCGSEGVAFHGFTSSSVNSITGITSPSQKVIHPGRDIQECGLSLA